MQRKSLTRDFSVSGQLRPHDLAGLAGTGVRSIINNRPDGETPDQTPGAGIEAECMRLGMGYRHVPVVQGEWNRDTVDAFAKALRELPGPVHAYCRSGMRSTMMWALQACAQGAPVEQVMSCARQAGYDLTPLYDSLRMAGGKA